MHPFVIRAGTGNNCTIFIIYWSTQYEKRIQENAGGQVFVRWYYGYGLLIAELKVKRNFHLSVFYFKTIRLLIFSKQCGDWEMHDYHPGLKRHG